MTKTAVQKIALKIDVFVVSVVLSVLSVLPVPKALLVKLVPLVLRALLVVC